MKDEMSRMFARLLASHEAAGAGLPRAPWDPDIEPFIWAGEPDAEEWCAWRPTVKTRPTDIAAAAPDLPALHPSIGDYFNSYWFCAIDGVLGTHSLTLEPVAPGIELDSFLGKARGYRRAHGGKLDQVPMGMENRENLLVVVNNTTGDVALEDFERRSFLKIADSLDDLIERLQV